MGVELLLLHAALTFVVCPGFMVYGVVIIARERVRVRRDRVLTGGRAILVGCLTSLTGYALTAVLWYAFRFYRT